MPPKTFHLSTPHRQRLQQHDDLIALKEKNLEKFHRPMTAPLMRENFQSHHVRFPDDWDSLKFRFVVLKDQIDLPDP